MAPAKALQAATASKYGLGYSLVREAMVKAAAIPSAPNTGQSGKQNRLKTSSRNAITCACLCLCASLTYMGAVPRNSFCATEKVTHVAFRCGCVSTFHKNEAWAAQCQRHGEQIMSMVEEIRPRAIRVIKAATAG